MWRMLLCMAPGSQEHRGGRRQIFLLLGHSLLRCLVKLLVLFLVLLVWLLPIILLLLIIARCLFVSHTFLLLPCVAE